MTQPIGFYRPDRLACTESPYHLPGVHNPWSNTTWCLCGAVTWPGDVGTWKSVDRWRYLPHDPARGIGLGGVGAAPARELVGWDTYWLEAA